MATLREIRKRIRSIKSIAKVTKAMQTVSASKMRRAQITALSTRPYANRAWEVLVNLVGRLSAEERRHQPLFYQRPVEAVGVLVITANRGLCGGYNHNVIQAATDFVAEQKVPVHIVTVGRRGRDFLSRHGYKIIADFELPDRPMSDDVRPIVRLLTDDLERGVFDQVWLVYSEFVSTLVQRPQVRLLLPVESTLGGGRRREQVPYLFEPDPPSILGPMLRRFTELQVYRALLEALASEHSARMVAMRAATDNALGLIDHLTLSYNKARQEAITKEILDIVGGAAALERMSSVSHR